MTTPRLGISSCLLGEPVRFDGGHKRNGFLTRELASYVEWVAVCPELESGMGVPRPTVRLERDPADPAAPPRMVDPKSRHDHTEVMDRWARRRVRQLAKLDLDGYVLKSRSPSCGMERVPVSVPPEAVRRGRRGGPDDSPRRDGRGLFAAELMEALPLLPVEEEGRLSDPGLRESFVERVFAFHRLKAVFAGRWSARAVVKFHTRHKLQLMAHHPGAFRELGRIVAAVKDTPRKEFKETYEREFMKALARPASRGRHTNVLQHMTGYFRKVIDEADRAELADLIEDYRTGRLPLVVPLSLVRHHARRHRVDYLLGQAYLDRDPADWMLRTRG